MRFSFDIIIWLRPEFKLEDDGVRSQNTLFQEEVDRGFEELIVVDNENVYQLKGSLEERVEQFKKIYDGKKSIRK